MAFPTPGVAHITGGRKTAAVTAQNTGTDWVQIEGSAGAWCALPYSISSTTSVVQLQRRPTGEAGTANVISATDGSGLSETPTLPRVSSYAASEGHEYRLWVPTGGYGNAVTLSIGA